MSVLGEGWLASIEAVEPGFHSPTCHATTIAETDHGLLLVFFGGEDGGAQHLWGMHRSTYGWGPAERLAASISYTDACWNPVLHRSGDGTLLLFYKQGSNCALWEGRLRRSSDEGLTWSKPQVLPNGIWGPIRNKPVELDDGTLICPSSTEHDGWHVHFERTPDQGRTWFSTGPIEQAEDLGAIQPTVIPWPSGRLQALCRSKAGCVVQTFSEDAGLTWSPLERTPLLNPNSAIDAVLLPDGRAALVYNPSTNEGRVYHGRRSPLAIATSEDGAQWRNVAVLEDADDEFSYPAAIVARDGNLHITYTAGRGWIGMRHVVVDPEGLERW